MQHKRTFPPFLAAPIGPVLFFFLFLFLEFIPAARANQVGNPGFEENIGSGTQNNWDSTNGAVRASSATITGLGFAAPPEGTARVYTKYS